MKLAFVTTLKPQNGAFYGAETSLMNLIESLRISNPETKISLIIRQPLLKIRKLSLQDKNYIQNFFNIPNENIFYVWLPYISFPVESLSIKSLLRFFITHLIIIFNKKKSINLFKQFDHIHINNTHLYLCQHFLKNIPYSQHVRDYINYSKLYNTKPKFLISIDKTTYRSLNKNLKLLTYILPNLYFPKTFNIIENDFYIKIKKFEHIFCLVGQIAKIKGVDYVIREFASLNNKNTCLIIVGGVTDYNYYVTLKKYAEDYNNIFFTGDVANVAEYYNFSHYNIRGDEHFCIGRTTIESAIHGIINILPLKQNEKPCFENDPISQLIKNNSVYYDARVSNSLKNILQNCIENRIKVKLDSFENPAIEVAKKFHSYITI